MTLRLHIGRGVAPGESISLDAAATRHAQVRRVQPGDALLVFDGRGGQWAAQVLRVGRQAIEVRVGEPKPAAAELPLQVTLAIGMPANERMDWLVEKATELGVAAIQPLHCARSVLKLDDERALRRQAHWQAIAVAACEQSGRALLPRIERPLAIAAWLKARAEVAARLQLSVDADAQPLRACLPLPAGTVLSLSGPEGGFTGEEQAIARAAGFEPVSLGPRTLRAETAPLALLAALATFGG